VLVLFGDGPEGRDLLLIQRASTVSSHAGQPAFPGGAVDDTDADVVAAALREAEEETGLDPAGVTVFATLPALWLPPAPGVKSPCWYTADTTLEACPELPLMPCSRSPFTSMAFSGEGLRV